MYGAGIHTSKDNCVLLHFSSAFLNHEWSKAVHTTVCERGWWFNSIQWKVSYLLIFERSSLTSAVYALMNTRRNCRRKRKDPYSKRISFMVIPLPWCFTFLWKWSMISAVMWWAFSNMTGCLCSKGKDACCNRPPTLKMPYLSRKGSSLIRGLFLLSLWFPPLALRIVISSSVARL